MEKLVSDVQALLSYLDISKVHFVGNSMGGLIGYELLETDADLLLSLTTFGTTAKSRNIADYDYTDTIRKNDIPMMLIKGGLDSVINKNLDSMLEVLKEKPDFEFHEL